ncbi:hypothetical protein [Mesoaciditoga sp.]
MQEPRELIVSLDNVTLEMLNALKMNDFKKLEKLYEVRGRLFDELKNKLKENAHFPEAELSKFQNDSQLLQNEMKLAMKKTKEKIEEISKNVELIRGYSVSKKDFHINERR